MQHAQRASDRDPYLSCNLDYQRGDDIPLADFGKERLHRALTPCAEHGLASEAVRGANGMMTGTGNTSATIHYIRKRPTKDFRADVSMGFDSRDNLRVTGDVSGPLNAEGTISGRGRGSKRSSCICIRCAMYPKR